MKVDPATGGKRPYPSHADQYRRHHGNLAWLYNPWTGSKRDAREVGIDTFGYLIYPPDESIAFLSEEIIP